MTMVAFALVVVALVVIAARLVTGISLADSLRQIAAPGTCAVLGHRRDGSSVRRSGAGYHARCRRCGTQLFKAVRSDAWSPAGATRSETEEGGAEIPARRGEVVNAYPVHAREEGSA